MASGVKTALAEYYNTNGAFPAGTGDANAQLEIEVATRIVGKYVEGVAVSDDGLGMITASFGSGNHAGKYVRLRAVATDGSVSFECDSDIEESYRPSECGEPTDSTSLTANFRALHNISFDHQTNGKPIKPPAIANPSSECDQNVSNGYPCKFRFMTQLRRAAYYDELADWIFETKRTNWQTKVPNNRNKRDDALRKGQMGGTRPFEQLTAEYDKLLKGEVEIP